MAFLGSFGKWMGKGLKGVSKAAGIIPGIGTLAGAGLGGLGELMEKGSKTNLGGFLRSSAAGGLSGAAGGLLGKLGLGGGDGIGGFLKKAGSSLLGGDGGGLGSLAKLLGIGLGGAATYGQYKQSKSDSKMARQLAQESLDNYRMARQQAQERWAAGSPLRDAFRFGAFQMADPTNPFSRGQMFQQFAPPAPGQQIIPGIGGNLGVTDTDPGRDMPINPIAPNSGTIIPGLGIIQPTDMYPGRDLPMGGRGIGDPTMRAASVKGPMVSQSQDRGRDRSDADERRRFN